MAKYRLDRPAWVQGRYISADVRNPVFVEFPDDFVPSRTWEPADKAAQTALLKLEVADQNRAKQAASKEPAQVPAPAPRPLVVVEAPAEPKKDEGMTMVDLAKMRGGKVVGAE